MRVLAVSSAALPTPLPEPAYGGLERIVASVCKYLGSKGHEVTLISAKGSRWSYGNAPKNVKVIETVDANWEDEARHFQLYKDLMARDFAGEQNCKDSIVWDNTWLAYPYLIPHLNDLRSNLVHTHHGLLESRTRPPPYNKTNGLLYPRFVGVSRAHAWHLSVTMKGIPVRCVHNGIDLLDYNPEECTDGGYLLSLNRITKEKGIKHCIDVAQQVRMPIHVVGDDTHVSDFSYVKEVIDMCRQSGGMAQYHGLVDEDTKNELIKHCTALVTLPEPTYIEAFGLGVVEAMQFGKPVIASDNGGIKDIINNNQNGFLVPHSADAVRILKANILNTIKPEECRKRAEHFSSDNMGSDYEKLFQGILEQGDKW